MFEDYDRLVELGNQIRGEFGNTFNGHDLVFTCRYCGKAFSVKRSEIISGRRHGVFCGSECQLKSNGVDRDVIDRVLSDVGSYNRNRKNNTCVVCGKPSGRRKSCSEECRFEAIRKRRTGTKHSPDTIEKMKTSKRGYKHSLKARLKMSISHMGLKAGSKHPRWGGGPKKQLYCEKWTPELRERVRIRFSHILGNRQCFECGKLESNNIDKSGKQTRLEVHHVYYNKKMCCDDSERLLIPLCKSCHSKTSAFGRKSKEEWIDYFIGKLNDINFDGVCWISKEEYATHKSASYKLRRSVKHVRQSLKAI